MAETCAWTYDEDDDTWGAGCDSARLFTLETGGPVEHKMAFCCYCGGALVEVRPEPELEDDDEDQRADARSAVRFSAGS